jgi:hypothetical protein
MRKSAAHGCPVAPAAYNTVQVRALHRACLIVGGVEALARRLDVAAALLEGWMRGDGEPPELLFREAVEIILLYASGAERPS